MRPYCIVAFIVLICCLGVAFTRYHRIKDSPAAFPVYRSYRDIPGVTAEEIEAIESLKGRYDRFVIGMTDGAESFSREDGSIGGYSRHFCQWMSGLFDVPFVTAIFEWEDLLEGLTSGAVHFTGELTRTEERARSLFMTGAIVERTVMCFSLKGQDELAEEAAERPLRYVFLDGAITDDLLRASGTTGYEALFASDYDQVIRMLETGAADAFLGESTAEGAFERFPHIACHEFYPLLYTPVSLCTADPELGPIIDVVQKYLDQGANYHLAGMYNEGRREYLRHKFFSRLSADEQAYLTERIATGPIPFAAEIDNYPACFYNQREKEWQGIAVDVLLEIESVTGLWFTVANRPDDPWGVVFQMLKDGRVAMLSELLPDPEREGQFLWSEPYARDYYALISKSELPDLNMNALVFHRIGIAVNTAVESTFTSWFPHHPNTVKLQSMDECLSALEKGDIDLTMGGRSMALRLTHFYEKPGFKINLVFNRTYDSCFGFPTSEAMLCSIVNKALRLVDVEKITDRWTRKVFDYRGKMAQAQVPYLVGLAALLGTVLCLVSMMLVRKQASSAELEVLVRQRTRELEVQTEAATVASRAKGEFLSRMSHEIRTPLNAVIGMATIARLPTTTPEERDKTLTHIVEASGHLMGILNDVLDMAKIESGKFTLVPIAFSLKEAMEEVGAMIRQRCLEKAITFTESYPSLPDMWCYGDKLRLNQVLINLLGNAVKFTHDNGRIDFSVRLAAESGDSYTVDFAVEDNGIGMTEAQMEGLFEAFNQADPSAAVVYGGTGLGLSISQNLVRLMNGEIRVRSRQGQGSTFFFTLTLPKTASPGRQGTTHHPDAPRLAGKRLLLVEDMAINRVIVRKLLEKTGVEIDEAHNGREALDKFAAAPPGHYHLIFMDIQMPLLNGYEATAGIRGLDHPEAATVPIIAMTANAYQSDIDAALATGMNGHLSKPIDIHVLYETLTRFILGEPSPPGESAPP